MRFEPVTYQSLPLAINEDHEFGTGVTHELAEGQRCSGRGDCHGPLEDCLQMTIKVQGVSKKRYFFDFYLISVLEVRFYFFTCVLESEFGARFI